MKKCTRCKQKKDYGEFNKNSSTKDGYQTQCKPCHTISRRESRQRNPKASNQRIQRHRDMKRDWIREQKARPCMDCGVQYPYYVMQFDHLRDKSFQIGNAYGNYPLEVIKAEVAKCEVVCANCHFERTHSRGLVKGDMV